MGRCLARGAWRRSELPDGGRARRARGQADAVDSRHDPGSEARDRDRWRHHPSQAERRAGDASVRLPPRTRIEETVLDLTDECQDVVDAIDWIARAFGRRLTTQNQL